ncbi:phage antirepressor KilAC domain-containing protein [Acinetobacter sp.]|uniref:Rha family transcriptional regulator n=1 Tax=Acinetobacter sp. TaxID=472 RepID=UPI0028A10A7B|nr:phage antirepressor KilAC domain-containing protein [Acinetobacter sp.]
MNIMTQFNHNQKSMSSREIADLTEKRHPDVKRDCEVMFQGLGIDVRKFAHIYFDSMNRQQTEYLLDEELTMTLVTGYNIVLRNRVIKRWKELENQNAVQLPQSFSEALQLAADQARQLELAAPKVQYFDRVADTKNLLNASQVGKKVGMSAVKLNQYLADMGVYDRRIAGRTFAQWFIDKGYGEVKQTEQGYQQSKFTNKGEQWVIEQLVSEGVVQ